MDAPRRRLGPASAVALVVASMIGSGIFTTSGLLLEQLGTPLRVLAVWLAGGVVALCGALCYGALGRRFPESGGEYHLLRETVHPLAGFLAGWVSLLAGFTGPAAAAAIGLGLYLAPWFGGADWRLVASAAILLVVLLHAFRTGAGAVAQNLVVAVKVLLLAAFAAYGAVRILGGGAAAAPAAAAAPPPELDWGAVAVALVWVSFGYSGWNAAVYLAGELREPDRYLRRSLLLGAGLVTALYLALNAVFLAAAPAAELAGTYEVGAVAAEALGGPALAQAVRGLVALALFTSLSSLVMLGPRVYARMAEDGLFPRLFRYRGRAPAAAVALQGGLALGAVWFSELGTLLGYLGFTLGLSAAATVLGLVRRRRREGATALPVPGWPLVPALYLVVTLGASAYMAWREPLPSLLGLGTIALGLPLWWRLRRHATAAAGPAARGRP